MVDVGTSALRRNVALRDAHAQEGGSHSRGEILRLPVVMTTTAGLRGPRSKRDDELRAGHRARTLSSREDEDEDEDRNSTVSSPFQGAFNTKSRKETDSRGSKRRCSLKVSSLWNADLSGHIVPR